MFRNKVHFYGEELLAPCPPPSWRTTPCQSSTTANSIYLQLSCKLEAVPPTATWGRAMPWWQGPTYHRGQIYSNINQRFTRIILMLLYWSHTSSQPVCVRCSLILSLSLILPSTTSQGLPPHPHKLLGELLLPWLYYPNDIMWLFKSWRY
jgi:hypothetical protein